MADFTAGTGFTLSYQSGAGTDASPVWSGTTLQFGGSAGSNELRWATSGATTTTPSASWPFITRIGSTFNVVQMWAFVSDAVGLQVSTYTGTNANANVFRWNWDTSGTFAAAPQFSAFESTAHTAPTPGDGTITGGATPDTGGTAPTSTSFLKINARGTLLATNATTLAAGAVGTAPTVTTGAQSLTTTTAANWLNTGGAWASAQGFTQGGIIFGSVPAATTANTWPWTCVMFIGPGLTTGSLLPVLTMQYSFT